MPTGDPQTYKYQATVDFVADKRASTRKMWLAIRPWNWFFIKESLLLAVIAGIGYSIGSSEHGGSLKIGLIVSAVLGMLGYVYWCVSRSGFQKDVRVLTWMDEKWECEITPKAYVVTEKGGVVTIIPWEAMQIKTEERDYLVIGYRKTTMMIYLSSLRAAGLEQEFRSRIGKKPVSDSAEEPDNTTGLT